MIFQLFPKATSILNHICIEEIQWVMMEPNCLLNVFCPKCPCEMVFPFPWHKPWKKGDYIFWWVCVSLRGIEFEGSFGPLPIGSWCLFLLYYTNDKKWTYTTCPTGSTVSGLQFSVMSQIRRYGTRIP